MKIIKNLKKAIILFIIIFFSIILINNKFISKADVINDSESYVEIYNSSGEVVAIVKMKNGGITVIAKSQTGSGTIKWASMGFTITRQPLMEINYTYRASEGNYYLKGYEDVSTVYSGGYAELYFNEAKKTSVTDPRTGITTATIEFSAKQIEEKLGTKFSDITKNTPIYLHGIFRTYEVDKNGKETDRKTHIKNWKDMLLAEWWDRSDNKLDEFAKYFNMKIEFQPARQDNTLYHYTDNNSKPINTKNLDKKLPGEYVSWSDEPESLTYKNVEYELYKVIIKVDNLYT